MKNIPGTILVAMLITACILTACGDEESPVVTCVDLVESYCDKYEYCKPGPGKRIECLRNAHEYLFLGPWDCEDVKRIDTDWLGRCKEAISLATCEEMNGVLPGACSKAFVIPGLQ